MKTVKDYEMVVHEYIPVGMVKEGDVVAIDIEIYGGIKDKLHRPIGEFACITACINGKDVYIMRDKAWLKDFLHWLEPGIWVFHKGDFDIRHLRRWTSLPKRDRYWDTMWFEKIRYNGYYDAFSLKALARRYLGVLMEKEVREEFSTTTEMTPEQIEYACYDALITWQIAQIQMKEAKKSELDIWYKFDQPILWSVLDMRGPMIDKERWLQIAKNAEAESKAIRERLGWNPNSYPTCKEKFKELGVTVKSTGEDVISEYDTEKYAPEVRQLVNDILSYRGLAKQVSTYGEKWLKDVEDDGRVYTSWNIIGAETGRFSSSDPNLQNIPSRKVPVYRECFIAPDGSVLIGGDYSAQEVRVAAFLSQDETLIQIFRDGKDPYIAAATEFYGEAITKKDPRRAQFKDVVLGLIYGMSVPGLADKLKVTKEEAEKLQQFVFKMYPNVHTNYVQKQLQSGAYVRTVSGRKSWLNHYTQQWERNALNSPVQGTASDMFKSAGSMLHSRWDYSKGPYPAVLYVHDEIVLEVLEEHKDYAMNLLRECMLEAGRCIIDPVPVEVDVKYGKNWAEIH